MRRIFIDDRAEHDIEKLTRDGIAAFGIEQAALYYDGLFRQFDLIADHPRLGHAIAPGNELYVFFFGSHVIVYLFDDAMLTIRRVLHGRMDIHRHL